MAEQESQLTTKNRQENAVCFQNRILIGQNLLQFRAKIGQKQGIFSPKTDFSKKVINRHKKVINNLYVL
jgi:hypothetical protein